MAKLGKRLKAAYEKLDREKAYSVDEALVLLKSGTATKFDQTVEVYMNLGVDPRHADQMVRGLLSLPNGTGKTVRVAVFAKGLKADEAKKAGADIVGDDDFIEEVKAGKINFDRVIATPDMMAKIGQVARILGPKGLMPNPKLGTVTNDIAKAVKDAKGGQVEYKADKFGIIHAGVGKLSFADSAILENILFFIQAIQNAKPTGVKGNYIKRISLSSTMGVGIKLDSSNLSSAAAAA